ncbi:MAG: hypothetical protein IJ371_03090 [Clostridia bacterium]|nr:hypothetical protein [Clostridia bacterium]
MELLKFIKANDNWEELLQQKPYCIKVKKDYDYTMLSYNQIESDFYNDVVRECRGIILENKTLMPVCVPFFKFGNYGEGYVPEIDWESATTQEKVDGSLIKVWFHNGKWRVSTNGTIDAYKCDIGQVDLLRLDCPFKSFGELFDEAMKNSGLNFDELDKDYTYMFELVSPYNKVVVPYENVEIYHIETRDNKTLKELNLDIGIKKPKQYSLKTLEDCLNSSSKLPYIEEGYVVVDKFWNRIKIKSSQYVAVHHLKNNGSVDIANVVQLLRENEIGEFLTYFPEFTNRVNIIKAKIATIIQDLHLGLAEIKDKVFKTQKDFALEVKDRPFSAFYFSWNKDKLLTPEVWFWRMDNNKIKEIVK